MEIVGVVGNTRMASPDLDPLPVIYFPHSQKTWRWLSWFGVLARVAPGSSVEALRPQFQSALWELDDQLPIQTFESVEQRYSARIAGRSFAMQLVLTFALVALLLSLVGLYGLMAYTVAQQRQEFGVRMALGARSSEIVVGVLRRSLRLAGLGLLLGLSFSLLAVKLLGSLLYGVSPRDPLTMVAISILVLMTAGMAAWLPAYRAVRNDPLNALKSA
jgi:ABC-type antimicrobial peptide transport system permease subunit